MKADTKILLVDDTKAHRSLFIRALKKAGIEASVIEGSSLKEGVELASTLPQGFHLAVIDLNLGDGLGTELVAELRKQDTYQSTPLIIFSTSPMESDREKSMASGASAYEIKESDPLAFREQVGRIVMQWLD